MDGVHFGLYVGLCIVLIFIIVTGGNRMDEIEADLAEIRTIVDTMAISIEAHHAKEVD